MIAEKMLLRWTEEKPGRSVQIFRYSRIRHAETPDADTGNGQGLFGRATHRHQG